MITLSSDGDSEREEKPPKRTCRLRRISRTSRRNSRGSSGSSAVVVAPRRESFFSEDEGARSTDQSAVAASASHNPFHFGKTASTGRRKSYLSSGDDRSEDGRGRVASLAMSDDESADDERGRRESQTRQGDSLQAVDGNKGTASVGATGPVSKPAQVDDALSDRISNSNISDVRTSVPSGLEGLEDSSRHGSSMRQDTDSGDLNVEQNVDEQSFGRLLPSEYASPPAVSLPISPRSRTIRKQTTFDETTCTLPIEPSQSPAHALVSKPDTKELESLRQQLEEFAMQQSRLSDNFRQALESERQNRADEISTYTGVIEELTRVLEEERAKREDEARSHGEELETRFEEHREKWESEIATLQADIRKHHDSHVTNGAKVDANRLGLKSTEQTSATDDADTRPVTPLTADVSSSSEATKSPFDLYTMSEAKSGRIRSTSPVASSQSGLFPDTPASYVVTESGATVEMSRSVRTEQLLDASRRTASPVSTIARDRAGTTSLNVWMRSLADELRESRTSLSPRGRPAPPEPMVSASFSTPPRRRPEPEAMVWLPPPVRVTAGSSSSSSRMDGTPVRLRGALGQSGGWSQPQQDIWSFMRSESLRHDNAGFQQYLDGRHAQHGCQQNSWSVPVLPSVAQQVGANVDTGTPQVSFSQLQPSASHACSFPQLYQNMNSQAQPVSAQAFSQPHVASSQSFAQPQVIPHIASLQPLFGNSTPMPRQRSCDFGGQDVMQRDCSRGQSRGYDSSAWEKQFHCDHANGPCDQLSRQNLSDGKVVKASIYRCTNFTL